MGIDKIIYVTNGERDHNGLTTAAKQQLKKVVTNVLEGENEDKTKIFRTCKDTISRLSETLLFLWNNTKKIDCNTAENVYSNFIQNPADTKEIANSSCKGNIAVVGVTQSELKTIVDTLKNNGYNVIDKDKIDHLTNIYAVTIDLNNTSASGFFTARRGQ